MEYIRRELERKFMSMNSVFKAVMVTGARQVGKSTMLKKAALICWIKIQWRLQMVALCV